jgi:hypothetical protein
MVLSTMRGKSSVVRMMNSVVVQGSVRMVISPLGRAMSGMISIPSYVEENTWVLQYVNGTDKSTS